MEMMNDVLLEGHLTNDPELKTLQSGSKLTLFSVSNTRQYKDNSGELREEFGIFPCEMWGSNGEHIHINAKKGDRVVLRGKLKQDRWQVDGETRTKFKLKIFSCVLTKNQDSDTDSKPTENSTKQSNIPF